MGKESILIGQNNAGKTTAIEALRVLSVAQLRLHTAQFTGCPTWLDGYCSGAGFRFSLETIDFDFANVHHAYDQARPAIIKAKLTNNNEIDVYIGQDGSQTFCQVRRGPRNILHSMKGVNTPLFGVTRVMPPVGSLLPHERMIAKSRLNKYMDGYLAYRHFRNQLWDRSADYRKFKQLLENTWPGLAIQSFDNDHGDARNEFSLLIREGRFTSEVSWHGHGLQAWMQTIWFLSRVPKKATIVLDEPDVYLHADLQRKLIKVIESMGFEQSILATHSSEIISDVPFSNVVVVQKRERLSRSAVNADQIQECLIRMGSIHSIQLAKIAQQGVILFVEGDDKPFLSDVAYKIGSHQFDHFSRLAVQEIGGKANWKESLGAAKALHEASSGAIKTVMLLDRDFMLNDEILCYYERSSECNLLLKIWKKKEIENYFIIPDAISRILSERHDLEFSYVKSRVCALIDRASTELRSDTVLRIAEEIQKRDRKLGIRASNTQAEALLQSRVDAGEAIVDIYGGKRFLSKLSAFVQEEFGSSISALAVCKEAKLNELSVEIVDFVMTICSASKIAPDQFRYDECSTSRHPAGLQ